MSKYNTDELLKLAESHYLKNEFNDALKLLIDNKNVIESPSLWHFNVGSLYLKKSDLGMARYHLEKAKNSFETQRLADRNIDSIIKNDYVFDISKSDNVFENMISYGAGSSIWDYSIIFFLIVVTNLLLLRMKKINKVIFSVGVVISLLPIGSYFYFKENYNTAIVIKDAVLREGPSKIYSENQIVPAGSKIIYGLTKNGWFLIDYPSVIKGWIEIENLKVIGN